MARSSPPEVPLTGSVATHGIETFLFFTPVGLGILGALFGVVAVSGAALVLHSAGAINSKVDNIPTATAHRITEPDVTSDQPSPATPIDDAPATDIPELTEAGIPQNGATAGPVGSKNAEIPVEETNPGHAANQDPPAVRSQRPLDDVRSKDGLLPIAMSVRDQKTVDLCTIGGVSADSIQLELVGNEFADGSRVTITKGGDVDALFWSATHKPASALARQIELGQFVLKDDQLSFLASRNSKNSLLNFCMLRISTIDPNDTELCRLWKPLQLQDLPVSFANSRAVYNLIPEELPQLPVKSLRMTMETARMSFLMAKKHHSKGLFRLMLWVEVCHVATESCSQLDSALHGRIVARCLWCRMS